MSTYVLNPEPKHPLAMAKLEEMGCLINVSPEDAEDGVFHIDLQKLNVHPNVDGLDFNGGWRGCKAVKQWEMIVSFVIVDEGPYTASAPEAGRLYVNRESKGIEFVPSRLYADD